MKEVRFFPDFTSLHRFLRGKSNEIKPIEAEKGEEKPKKAKKTTKKVKGE